MNQVEDDDEARADAVAAAKRSSAACAARNAATAQCRASVRRILAKHARPLQPCGSTISDEPGEAQTVNGATQPIPVPEFDPPPYRQQFFGSAALDEDAYTQLWAWAESLGADLDGVR